MNETIKEDIALGIKSASNKLEMLNSDRLSEEDKDLIVKSAISKLEVTLELLKKI